MVMLECISPLSPFFLCVPMCRSLSSIFPSISLCACVCVCVRGGGGGGWGRACVCACVCVCVCVGGWVGGWVCGGVCVSPFSVSPFYVYVCFPRTHPPTRLTPLYVPLCVCISRSTHSLSLCIPPCVCLLLPLSPYPPLCVCVPLSLIHI